MKKIFMLLIAVVMLVPISTQARHIKIYTFNGKGRPQTPTPVPPNDTTGTVAGITLGQTLNAGDTLMLQASVLPDNAPNKNVLWASSNPTVATVNNGKITALTAGTTTITATAQDGNKIANYDVTVNYTYVTGVSLNIADTMLAASRGFTLLHSVQPTYAHNKNVAWTSSDTTVATVSSNGVVTAVGLGTTSITVATQDGNKTATCNVAVGCPLIVGKICWSAVNIDDYQSFADKPDMYTKFYQWNRSAAWAAADCGMCGAQFEYSDLSTSWSINPCPKGWRLPTVGEFSALSNVGYSWANINVQGNSVAGIFYGTNTASCSLPNNMSGCIFLPAVGHYMGYTTNPKTSSFGNYWSSTYTGDDYGYVLDFAYDGHSNAFVSRSRTEGHSIRCVQDVE